MTKEVIISNFILSAFFSKATPALRKKSMHNIRMYLTLAVGDK